MAKTINLYLKIIFFLLYPMSYIMLYFLYYAAPTVQVEVIEPPDCQWGNNANGTWTGVVSKAVVVLVVMVVVSVVGVLIVVVVVVVGVVVMMVVVGVVGVVVVNKLKNNTCSTSQLHFQGNVSHTDP